MQAIKIMKEYDQAHEGAGASLTDEEMSKQVLLRMMNNILVKEAAKSYNLSAEESDLEEVVTRVLSQFKSPEEADKELEKRYGWNMKTYKEKVMRPYILQNKLAEAIQDDTKMQSEVKSRAEDLLKQIKEGADFSEMAKKYGEDGTAANGGDLGWFARGEMVPQFEAAAFALKKGEMAEALVESPYGYHLIIVDDKKVEKSKDAKGKWFNKEMVKARHILIRFPSIDKYLDKLLRESSLHLYINVANPLEVLKK